MKPHFTFTATLLPLAVHLLQLAGLIFPLCFVAQSSAASLDGRVVNALSEDSCQFGQITESKGLIASKALVQPESSNQVKAKMARKNAFNSLTAKKLLLVQSTAPATKTEFGENASNDRTELGQKAGSSQSQLNSTLTQQVSSAKDQSEMNGATAANTVGDKDKELNKELDKDKDKDKDKNKEQVTNTTVSNPATTTTKRRKPELLDVLPCLTWVDADQEQKAVLLCVHGLGLNNGSYEDFGKRMAKLGYFVYAVDVPGFGSFKNAEGRDRVDFDACMQGISDTLRLIHKVNRRLPVYILGESMGGAIALRVTSEHPDLVDGLISSVPSGDRFKQGKETLRVGLKLLTAPNTQFDIGTSVIQRATQDEKLRKAWAEDPLNRMNLTPKELLRFQGFMNENHENAKRITSTPVLFVQGCKDMLVRPEGTQQLFNDLGSHDRQIELIHDKEHLIFEEGQFDDQVIGIVDKWLLAHIESSKLTKQ